MTRKPGSMLCCLLWCSIWSNAAGLDLSIDATLTPNPANVGQPFTWTITITNQSQVTATAVSLSNSLDETLSIQSAVASIGVVEIRDSEVLLHIDSLAGGSASSLQIVAVPPEARSLTFISVAIAAEAEEILWNNSYTFAVEARGVPNNTPTITISSSAQEGVVDAFIDLAVIAQPFDSDGSIAKVQFFVDSFEVAVKNEPPFSFEISAIRPGTYTLTVRTSDNLGASATAHAQVTARAVETNKFLFPTHSDGVFNVLFSGHYYDDFVIEAKDAAAASAASWTPIAQLSRTNFSSLITDPEASSSRARIYRARKVEP